MKFSELFKYFFLEDTADTKSFSMGRFVVFWCTIGSFISTVITLYVGVNNYGQLAELVAGNKSWIPADTGVLTILVGFTLGLWGIALGGKALNRFAEKEQLPPTTN